jgi:hypothetical protein
MGYDEIFGDLLGNRDAIMFSPGPLLEVRNPESGNGYDTHYGTYQYFAYAEVDFQGTYADNKPNMRYTYTYPARAAIWGTLTVTKGNGNSLAFNEPNTPDPISGMNAVYLDGSGGWFKPDDLEVFFTAFSDRYYWPIPGN